MQGVPHQQYPEYHPCNFNLYSRCPDIYVPLAKQIHNRTRDKVPLTTEIPIYHVWRAPAVGAVLVVRILVSCAAALAWFKSARFQAVLLGGLSLPRQDIDRMSEYVGVCRSSDMVTTNYGITTIGKRREASVRFAPRMVSSASHSSRPFPPYNRPASPTCGTSRSALRHIMQAWIAHSSEIFGWIFEDRY